MELSLRDLSGEASRVLGREFLSPFGMYELLALASTEYGRVGERELE